MYNLKPVGKYHLKICTNVACCLRGADELVEHCEKKWDIKCGETTRDKKFTLMEEECLGACGTAPAMMLNDDYHENLDAQKLDQTSGQAEVRQTTMESETLYIQHFNEEARPLDYYLAEDGRLHGAEKSARRCSRTTSSPK